MELARKNAVIQAETAKLRKQIAVAEVEAEAKVRKLAKARKGT